MRPAAQYSAPVQIPMVTLPMTGIIAYI